MKKERLLLPILALALLASCSKDFDPSGGADPSIPQGDETAFVAVTIPNVKSDVMRASTTEDGTIEESTVAKVRLLIFDKAYNYIGLAENSKPIATDKFMFEVASDAYRFFVIVNSNASIDAGLANLNGNWNTVERDLQYILGLDSRDGLAEYTSDNEFPMVNAGSYADNEETVLVTPLESEFEGDKLKIDPDDPSLITIKVDRMVAKFDAAMGDTFKVYDKRNKTGVAAANSGDDFVGEVEGTGLYGKIEGVRLNVTNRKSYIYSHIIKVNDNGDDYRTDPNMDVVGEPAKPQGESTALLDNFFWLHNYASPTFNTLGAASKEYLFENTAYVDFCNYNNLTQLIVKATYRPTGFGEAADGENTELEHNYALYKNSWFSIDIEGYGTMQMTFKGVQEYYEAITTSDPASGRLDLATAAKMDIQLQYMLQSATFTNGIADIANAKWNDANLTCEVLNSIPNGGYVAATVPDTATPGDNYVVQFYQFGINYYDVFIHHDSDENSGHMGRWGMVRNNGYSMKINSITDAGRPYIPDPTDPDIKDPTNPNPTDPEKADKDMAIIQATIDANPWTMWSQDVDL